MFVPPAPGQPSEKADRAEDYELRSVEQLRERAQELGIEGRSTMSRRALIEALRNH